MANWTVKNKYGDFKAISQKYGISMITARLLVNRKVEDDNQIDAYLNGTIQNLRNPFELSGIKDAVELILDCIEDEKLIRVIGDYDIDGVSATYILTRGLKEIGGNVSNDIPSRTTDGYGLNERLVEKCIEDGINLIITVDNGIAALSAIKLAKENNITVIVTDHHQVQDELPCADVIIDPHMPSDPSLFKNICGGFVAFKLVQALYRTVGVSNAEEEKLIPYAAIATIGDIMPLIDENRILVKEGLKRMPDVDSIGLSELFKLQQLTDKPISVYHIGFIIGPCINASGRLDTAKKALDLLNTTDKSEATRLAGDLKALNEWRKDMTKKWSEEAIKALESASNLPKVIVCYLPDCHESIAGIVAGRIKEHFNHPTFVLTNSNDVVKGSGRSIEGYDMFGEMNAIKELFIKFGGHPMAAGLSIKLENLHEFDDKINNNCTLKEKDFEKKVKLDMQLPFAYVSEKLIDELAILSPYGPENETPLFGESKVTVLSTAIIGAGRNVLRIDMIKDNVKIRGVYFGEAEEFAHYIRSRNNIITIAYYPTINEFRGQKTVQLVIKHYK